MNNISKKYAVLKQCFNEYGVNSLGFIVKAVKINKKYGISIKKIISRDLINASDERLAMVAKERMYSDVRHLKKIHEATGWSEEEVKERCSPVLNRYDISLKNYYDNRMYLMSDDEIDEFVIGKEKAYEEKVDYVVSETGWSRQKVNDESVRCMMRFRLNFDNYVMFHAWNLTDQQIENFVTMNMSQKLKNKLNKRPKLFVDKLLFVKNYGEYLHRKIWFNRDTSFEEFKKFAAGLNLVFCKPLSSSKGRGAEKFELTGDLKRSYDQLMRKEPMIVEEYILQHDELNRLYSGSVNTIRLCTILKDGVCHHLGGFLKIGVTGSVDSMLYGGIYAGIDEKTGKLITPGVDSLGRRFEKHAVTGVTIQGFQIPRWDDVVGITEEAQMAMPENGFVGWDIAVRNDDAVIVEGNSRPNLASYQACFAASKEGKKPLFETYLS